MMTVILKIIMILTAVIFALGAFGEKSTEKAFVYLLGFVSSIALLIAINVVL